jgi:hypothetical protein
MNEENVITEELNTDYSSSPKEDPKMWIYGNCILTFLNPDYSK